MNYYIVLLGCCGPFDRRDRYEMVNNHCVKKSFLSRFELESLEDLIVALVPRSFQTLFVNRRLTPTSTQGLYCRLQKPCILWLVVSIQNLGCWACFQFLLVFLCVFFEPIKQENDANKSSPWHGWLQIRTVTLFSTQYEMCVQLCVAPKDTGFAPY